MVLWFDKLSNGPSGARQIVVSSSFHGNSRGGRGVRDSVPLLTRVLPLLFLAQSNPGPAFEVASVKPAPAASAEHRGIKIDSARVDITYWSIRQLILRAYEVWEYQFAGPGWAATTRFDVAAKLPEGARREQIPA